MVAEKILKAECGDVGGVATEKFALILSKGEKNLMVKSLKIRSALVYQKVD